MLFNVSECENFIFLACYLYILRNTSQFLSVISYNFTYRINQNPLKKINGKGTFKYFFFLIKFLLICIKNC